MLWRVILICSLSVTYTVGTALIRETDLQKCRKQYDEKVGQLIASSGMSLANAVWRIAFNNLDLNENKKISASELILMLSSDHLISTENTRSVLSEAQAWINSVVTQDDNNNRELTYKQFVDLVGDSIGQKESKVTPNREKIVGAVCVYLNQNIPRIAQSIKDLSNCSSALKNQQLEIMASSSGKLAINLWKATFVTLDQNNDMTVTTLEIANTSKLYNSSLNQTNESIERKMAAFIPNQTLTNSQFFATVTSLLFGSKKGKTWQSVSSQNELEGKKLFCHVLRQTHDDIKARLSENAKCVASYKKTLKRVFNNDATFAPAYIFTLTDVNKDGFITSQILAELVYATQNQKVRFDKHYNTSYDKESFERILPDKVVEVNSNSSTDKRFELSLLSSKDLKVWNSFCLATIEVLESFPSSIKQKSEEYTSNDMADIVSLRELERRLTWMEMNNSGLPYDSVTSQPEVSESDDLSEALALGILSFDNLTASNESNSDNSTVLDISTKDYSMNFTDDVLSTEPYLYQMNTSANSTNNSNNLIPDLLRDNHTETNTTDNNETVVSFQELDLGNGVEKAKNNSLSQEELELYQLLLKYKNEMKSETSTPKKVLASIEDSDRLSALSQEEKQLRLLLKNVILEESNLN